VVVILQIEHVDAVAQIDDILDTSGIDVVCLGPTDLSGSAGVLRQFEHPVVVDSIAKVLGAAKKRKLPACLGVIRPDEETRKWQSLGASFMVTCEDVSALGTAVRSSLDHMRSVMSGK
jgi:2-keto-3-deoxy-L-rhamnonate aldolase RhmA